MRPALVALMVAACTRSEPEPPPPPVVVQRPRLDDRALCKLAVDQAVDLQAQAIGVERDPEPGLPDADEVRAREDKPLDRPHVLCRRLFRLGERTRGVAHVWLGLEITLASKESTESPLGLAFRVLGDLAIAFDHATADVERCVERTPAAVIDQLSREAGAAVTKLTLACKALK